jgi:hypothetical protein
MNLQNKAIVRYRQLYPSDTLREISSRTGIQITRVHRLFHEQKQMKVDELEALERCIMDKFAESPNVFRLTEAVNLAAVVLADEELGKLVDYIERKNTARKYGRMCSNNNFESAIIA